MTVPFGVDPEYERWKKQREKDAVDYDNWRATRGLPTQPGQRFSEPDSPSIGGRVAEAFRVNPVAQGIREGVGTVARQAGSFGRTVSEMVGSEGGARGSTSLENWGRSTADDAAANLASRDGESSLIAIPRKATAYVSKLLTESAPAIGAAAAAPVGLGALAAAGGVGYVQAVGEGREQLEEQGVNQDSRNKAALLIGLPVAGLQAIVPAGLGSRLGRIFANEANAVGAEVVQTLSKRAVAAQLAKSAVKTSVETALTMGAAEGVNYTGQSMLDETPEFSLGEAARRAGGAALEGAKAGLVLGGVTGGIEAMARPRMLSEMARAEQVRAEQEATQRPVEGSEPPVQPETQVRPPEELLPPEATQRPPVEEAPPPPPVEEAPPPPLGIEPPPDFGGTPDPNLQPPVDELADLRKQANTDHDTGLGNARAKQGHLERLAREGTEGDHDFVELDLEALKVRNDNDSYEAGTREIQRAASAMAQAADELNLPTRDLYRHGGDELSAVVPKGQGEAFLKLAREYYGEHEIPGTTFANRLGGAVGESATTAEKALQLYKANRPKDRQSRPSSAKPGDVVMMKSSDIIADPERLQFKSNVDRETGAGSELKDVKWNPNLAGVLSVWKDPADGKTYVVNGHHRLELANRTGGQDVAVRYVDAPDVKTARAAGAFINLAEGRGTPVDVAKFMRDHGATIEDLKAENVSVRGDLAKKGIGLSRLSQDLFDRVATGKLDENHAAAIGSIIEKPELQREAVNILKGAGRRMSVAEVTELARQVEAAGSEATSQETLFGTETVDKGLYVDRARVSAGLKKRLAGDKRLYGYIAKEGRAAELEKAGGTKIDVDAAREIAEGSATAEEVFDRLSTRSGPIAEAVTSAARRVAQGEDIKTVLGETYDAIRAGVDAEQRALTSAPRDPGSEEAGRVGPALTEGGEASPEIREDGRVTDSTDENQSGLFGQPQDLFGNELEPTVKQGDLLGRDAGKRGAPKELPGKISAEEMAGRRDELGFERSDTPGADDAGQGALFSPAGDTRSVEQPTNAPSSYGKAVRKVLGVKPSRPLDEVRTLRQIGRQLGDSIGAWAEEGRGNFARMKAAGWFNTYFENIRLRRWDSKKLHTAVHEFGHFISKKHLGWPTRNVPRSNKIPLTARAVKELEQMGRDLYGSRKAAAGYGEEGIAQWFGFFVTDPAVNVEKAPEFSRIMQDVFKREPDMHASFAEARRQYVMAENADPETHIESMTAIRPEDRNVPTKTGLMTRWEDRLQPVRELARKAAEVKGGALDPAANFFFRYKLLAGIADRASNFIKYGPTPLADGDIRRVARPIKDALEKVTPGRLRNFGNYLTAKRVVADLDARGLDTGFDVAKLKRVVEKYEKSGEFEEAAAVWWENAHAMMDYRAGITHTPEEVAAMKRDNPHYLSFERQLDADQIAAGSKGSGNSMKRIRGSSLQIKDPLGTMMTAWHKTISSVHQHQALQSVVEMAMKDSPEALAGSGNFIQEVEAPQVKREFSFSQIEAQLKRMGLVMAEGADPQTVLESLLEDAKALPGDGEVTVDNMMERLAVWQDIDGPRAAENRDRVFPLVIDGKRRWFQVKDRDFFDSIVHMTPRERGAFTEKIAQPLMRTFRTGATATLEFGLGSNPIRDAFTALGYSRAGFHAPGYLHMKGLAELFNAGEHFHRFMLSGAGSSGQMMHDALEARTHLKRLAVKPSVGGVAAYVVKNPVDALRLVAGTFEAAGRIGEFKALHGKYTGEGMSGADATVAAAVGGRDITQDFNVGGTTVQAANAYIAFLMAKVQGTARAWRTLSQPTRLEDLVPGEGKYDRMRNAWVRNSAVLTTMSVATYLMQKDDPEYKRIPAWMRHSTWPIIHRGNDRSAGWDGYGSGKVEYIAPIPKPPTIGLLFCTLPEMFMEYLDKHDPEVLSSTAKYLASEINPLGFSPSTDAQQMAGDALSSVLVTRGAAELFANKNVFANRPIVPRGLESALPEDQYTDRTSDTFIQFGKTFGISPAKAEHLYRSVTAGLGKYGTDITDEMVREMRKIAGAEPLKKEGQGADGPLLTRLPGFRRLFTVPRGANSESLQKFYDQYDAANQVYTSFLKKKEGGNALATRAFIEKHRAELGQMSTQDMGGTGPFRATMAELNKLRKQAAAAATEDQRRAIYERMNQLAEQALSHGKN